MKKRSTMFRTMLTAVAVTACGDQSAPIAPVDGPEASLVPGTEIAALKRSTSQPTDLVATATIGRKGGTIAVGGAVLRVPAGALSEDTEITMTVPAGDYLQVQFAPHGLTFTSSATLQLSLRGTAAEGDAGLLSNLVGAYFLDSLDDGLATVLELRPVSITGTTLRMPIDHFSGYCVADGKECIC